MAKFKDGALVRLKSGGPTMTVSYVIPGAGRSNYTCQWFKGQTCESASFGEDSLEAAPNPTISQTAAVDDETVAQFMVTLIERDTLEQSVAATQIVAKFGDEHVKTDKNGLQTISKLVLKRFAELTPDFTWEPGTKTWRKKSPGEKGRTA